MGKICFKIIKYPIISNFGLKSQYHLEPKITITYTIPVGIGNIDIDHYVREATRQFSVPLQIQPDIFFPTLTDDSLLFPITDTSNNNIYAPVKYPSYCCQKCGEPIGWLGRFFQWLPFKFLKHKCKSEI